MTAAGFGSIQASPLTAPAHSVVTTILNPFTTGFGALAGLALSKVAAWVLAGTRAALIETAHAIGATTSPALTSAWFSSTYWRVAGLAALVTVPFVCAAALQAVMRSDLSLLTQAVLLYLPLALLGVSLAAPVTMLLLAATDGMCTAVSGPGATDGARFLIEAGGYAGGLSAIQGSPFFAVVAGLVTVAAGLALTIELLVREAAVYVVVLMLPLVFAGLVWPARRIWAIRMIELLVGLILSKFVIVAVLSLAGTALGGASGGSRLLTAMALIVLSTFAPWAMLRLLPFTELAAGASEALSHGSRRLADPVQMLAARADPAVDLALSLPAMLRRDHDRTDAAGAGRPGGAGLDADAVLARRDSRPESAVVGAELGGSAVAAAASQPADGGPVGYQAPAGGPVGDQAPGCVRDDRPGSSGARAEDASKSPSAGEGTGGEPGLPPILRAPNRSWPPVRLEPGFYRQSIAGPAAPDTAEQSPVADSPTGDLRSAEPPLQDESADDVDPVAPPPDEDGGL